MNCYSHKYIFSWTWFDYEVSIIIICKQNTPKTVEDGGGEASTSSTSVAESRSVQSVNDGATFKRADRGKNRGGPFRGGFIRGAGRGGSSRGGSSQNADSRRGNFRGNSRVSFNLIKTLRLKFSKKKKKGGRQFCNLSFQSYCYFPPLADDASLKEKFIRRCRIRRIWDSKCQTVLR